MLWLPYVWRVNKAQAVLLDVLVEEIQFVDGLLNDKLKKSGFEDWEIYGKNEWYIPTIEDKVDMLVEKIKESEENE